MQMVGMRSRGKGTDSPISRGPGLPAPCRARPRCITLVCGTTLENHMQILGHHSATTTPVRLNLATWAASSPQIASKPPRGGRLVDNGILMSNTTQ
jgi:hypothetical protein